jgi:hypothetical protein
MLLNIIVGSEMEDTPKVPSKLYFLAKGLFNFLSKEIKN